ncbi:hypothetical protein JW978_02785 [Candidatus Dojkabacteria bacterium]|nr:hypothetical protein [Candidatus Dojkabacteria bacterium]
MDQIDSLSQEMLGDLAIIGRGITQAYSEENQDLGGDLMLAKSTLQKIRKNVLGLEISETDKSGLKMLFDYFEQKIERRLSGGDTET